MPIARCAAAQACHPSASSSKAPSRRRRWDNAPLQCAYARRCESLIRSRCPGKDRRQQFGTRAPIMDSELVRTCLPIVALRAGNDPFCFSPKAVPWCPAPTRRRPRLGKKISGGVAAIQLVDLMVSTSYPEAPSSAPESGLTSTTLVSGMIRAPFFSARYR